MVKCLGCIVEEQKNSEVEFSTYYKRNKKTIDEIQKMEYNGYIKIGRNKI